MSIKSAALPALSWSMQILFGILILLRTSISSIVGASNSKWIPSSCYWRKSFNECIQELNWLSFQQCHKYFSVCCIHDSLHYRNSLSSVSSQVSTRCNPLSIWTVTSSINPFHYSFFVNSPFLWNTIPHMIL